VYGPILAGFKDVIDQLISVGLAVQDDRAFTTLARGLRNLLTSEDLRGTDEWLREAPRLISRLIAEPTLVGLYLDGAWSRFRSLAEPKADDGKQFVPWTLIHAYEYPRALGGRSDVACELTHVIAAESAVLREWGFLPSQLDEAHVAVCAGLGLARMARNPVPNEPAATLVWAYMRREFWPIVQSWEEDLPVLDAFASLAGEQAGVFRARLRKRLEIVRDFTHQRGVFGLESDSAWRAVSRIGDQQPPIGSDTVL
jgi:hypothetical protein